MFLGSVPRDEYDGNRMYIMSGPISFLPVIFCAYELSCVLYQPDTDPDIEGFLELFLQLVSLEIYRYILQNSKMTGSECFK